MAIYIILLRGCCCWSVADKQQSTAVYHVRTRIGSQLNKTQAGWLYGIGIDRIGLKRSQSVDDKLWRILCGFQCGGYLVFLSGLLVSGSVVARKFRTYRHNIFLHIHSFSMLSRWLLAIEVVPRGHAEDGTPIWGASNSKMVPISLGEQKESSPIINLNWPT